MANQGRTSFGPTLLAGLGGAALAAVAAAKPVQVLERSGSAALVSPPSGWGDAPLASALSLVALAAWGALLVTRGKVRRVVAALGGLASLGVVVGLVVAASRTPAAVFGNSILGSADGVIRLHASGWFWAGCVGAAITAAAFGVAVRKAASWPSMSARYDRPERAETAEAPTTNHDIWKAIDAGDDPTDSPAPDDPSRR